MFNKKEYDKNYYFKNKKIILERCKKYRALHKKEHYESNKKWSEKNRDKNRISSRKYYLKNKKKATDATNKYKKERAKKDIVFKFREAYTKRIYLFIRKNGYKKKNRAEEILGCTFEELINYIESKLPKGKTIRDLGRYGYHIDHIIPLASAKTEADVIRLCHYTNLQPLWWRDNIIKRDKIIT